MSHDFASYNHIHITPMLFGIAFAFWRLLHGPLATVFWRALQLLMQSCNFSCAVAVAVVDGGEEKVMALS
jgi:hypothetical protein